MKTYSLKTSTKAEHPLLFFKDNVFHLIFQGFFSLSVFDGGFFTSGLRREKKLAFRWEFLLALKPIEMETGTDSG